MRPFVYSCTRVDPLAPSRSLSPQRSLALKRKMSTDLNIESTDIQYASGVNLSADQKTVVGCVLDLFAGKPSLQKLKLWEDDAVFEDPLTIAKGRKQYEPQWYGLQSAFSKIERLAHEVTSVGNPISMNLTNRYVMKGLNKEQTINSVVDIYVNQSGKIERVEDKWDGNLPDSSFRNAFRKLNAVSVPKMVGVPKTEEEDARRGN
ncbi:hypothetical protein BDY21DRAFT_406142 [Lineolata rhizophorae]|uniref:SnoaL-like domain-containing protein n=1 Tax=Lineolata rhizophorae TaxID=578093 RepID=A0A6A6PAF7_9PEZI|nr:hypothetical protein BDY21DRAFT_406142 [Lineolata rhizophorae]